MYKLCEFHYGEFTVGMADRLNYALKLHLPIFAHSFYIIPEVDKNEELPKCEIGVPHRWKCEQPAVIAIEGEELIDTLMQNYKFTLPP